MPNAPAWFIVRDDGEIVGSYTTPEGAEVIRAWQEQEEPNRAFSVIEASEYRREEGDD